MKKCKQGYYYCYKDKKCKKIPLGYRVGLGGWLRREKEEEKEEEQKNGNGANGNGNGNGDSSGNSNGGGVSEAWSAKYKRSIDCNNPKGFSQRAHCQGRKKVNEAKEKDHEVSMAQSQLKKSEENIRKLRKALGKKERNIPAWVQAKITDTEHNTDAASSYMDEGKRDGKSAKDKGYSLRDWFKGGGWVQAGGKYDGKPCAKQPGQKTKPFCRDADDRASMSKDERERRAKKKRKEDPNPNRKGKAKMVRESNWRSELDEGIFDFLNPKNQEKVRQGSYHKDPKAKKGTIFSNVSKRNEMLKRLQNQSYELEGELVDEAKIGYSNPSIKGKPVPYPKGHPKEGKPMSFNKAETEGMQKYDDYYRKTGKRIPADQPLPEEKIVEGKKDACYHKVKSRYSVWPSAYASGALVKCRKVGAKNWGNKTKNEDYEFSNWRDDFQALEYESVDVITPEPLQPTQGLGSEMLEEGGKKCWKGYKKAGTQKLFGKTYNRCVKAHFSDWRADMDLQEKKAKKDYDGDGKIESGEEEYKGSRDKAIKKAIAMKEDWQSVNKKDKTDGMSQKAVNAYKRENPGSKLKTAVTEKNPGGKRAKRRKSFCARSNGQRKMHNIDCSATPDKAICKARKRWRC